MEDSSVSEGKEGLLIPEYTEVCFLFYNFGV